MSLLLFYVGDNGYAIDSRYIIYIVPHVDLKKIPSMPSYFAGLLNLGGKAIPVVDFCQIIEQRPTRFLLSSRIMLVKDPRAHSELILGILGEKMKELIDVKKDEFKSTDFSSASFPYLNRVLSKNEEMIQYLDLELFFEFLAAEVFQRVEKL